TGHAVAVEIGLLAPDATANADALQYLRGAAGRVAGTATKGTQTITFDGPIEIDRSLASAQTPLAALQRIDGAACDLTFTAAPQQLALRVDPRPWFDAVDFASLTDAGDGTFTWDAHTTFGTQLLQGVQTLQGAYAFTLAAR